MELFALQLVAQQNGRRGGEDEAWGILVVIFIVIAVLVAIGITIRIFYLLAVSRCLLEIDPRNRTMEPGSVWLCLIPLFGAIWEIIMMFRVADSLAEEYRDRRLRGDGDFGKMMAILYLVGIVAAAPLALVAFVLHWVKVVGYTKELAADRGGYGDYDDREDYDARPRRKRARRDDYEDDDRDESRPWARGRR